MTVWPFKTANASEQDGEAKGVTKLISRNMKRIVKHESVQLSLVALDQKCVYEIQQHPVSQARTKVRRTFIQICASYLAHKIVHKGYLRRRGTYTVLIRWKNLKRAFKVASWATGKNLQFLCMLLA
jgi:hypothetical protein